MPKITRRWYQHSLPTFVPATPDETGAALSEGDADYRRGPGQPGRTDQLAYLSLAVAKIIGAGLAQLRRQNWRCSN